VKAQFPGLGEGLRKDQKSVGGTHPDVALFVAFQAPDPGTQIHGIAQQVIACVQEARTVGEFLVEQHQTSVVGSNPQPPFSILQQAVQIIV